MSIFVKKLKAFQSDITGTTKEYNVNAGIWLFLESDYGIKQSNWLTFLDEEQSMTYAKFVHAVFKANKITDVTLEEILCNTDDKDLAKFVNDYSEALYPELKEEKKEQVPSTK